MDATPSTGSARDSAKALRVLVVADDPALEDEFQGAFARIPDRQSAVLTASAVQGAVDAARRRPPALIVIDVDRDAAAIGALVRELQVHAPDAVFAATFAPDRLEQSQSEGATVIELLRAQVRDFIRRPVSATELRAVIDRLFAPKAVAAAARDGLVIALVSGKGGVGRSTLAVNVACGLALRHPDDVLLVDTSLQVGTSAMLLDLPPTSSIVDAIRERDRLDRTLMRHLALRHDSGLRVLAAPPDTLDSAEVDDEAVSRLLQMARRAFRYVVVDTAPALDGVLMTVLDLVDLAVLVAQGTAPSVAGLARWLPVLEGLGLSEPRQRIVLNYNYQPFAGDLRPLDIATRLQRSVDHVIPYDKRVLASVNSGRPRILSAGRWDRFGRAVTALVDELENWTTVDERATAARAGSAEVAS